MEKGESEAREKLRKEGEGAGEDVNNKREGGKGCQTRGGEEKLRGRGGRSRLKNG